jgi:secreted PhoX family phosphatase
MFLSVQEPGAGGSASAPASRWPDGGQAAPRPSLVAIEPSAPGRKLGS